MEDPSDLSTRLNNILLALDPLRDGETRRRFDAQLIPRACLPSSPDPEVMRARMLKEQQAKERVREQQEQEMARRHRAQEVAREHQAQPIILQQQAQQMAFQQQQDNGWRSRGNRRITWCSRGNRHIKWPSGRCEPTTLSTWLRQEQGRTALAGGELMHTATEYISRVIFDRTTVQGRAICGSFGA